MLIALLGIIYILGNSFYKTDPWIYQVLDTSVEGNDETFTFILHIKHVSLSCIFVFKMFYKNKNYFPGINIKFFYYTTN